MDMSPLTLQEAQLMEKPVIATNVGGIPELIKDGETGFLVEKGNHKQIIEKISFLLENPEIAGKMGIAGKKFIEENFSWEKIAEEFKNIIDDLESDKH
jgi:glycosyltransferase involved in cell wall biosynthesis